MTNISIERLFRGHGFAATSYVLVVLALCMITVVSVINVIDQYHARTAASEMLNRLRDRPDRIASDAFDPAARGTPFLEGQTVTLATAALLHHLSNTITKAGGSILSTEIETPGLQPKDGYLRAMANCELDQPAVQQLLYDIESGVPFLFIDQLVVQPAAAGSGRMRVLVGVSGVWEGGTR